METEMEWDEHQEWERGWWGNCANTMAEERKQEVYAQRMGLINEPRDGKWPVYDLKGKSVLDIGGGPVSMLLKTVNGGTMVVADPCNYPGWVAARYAECGIYYERVGGEEVVDRLAEDAHFDEVWIYNVLQHVDDPEKIIKNALKLGTIIRMFEWVDMGVHPGHPHDLKAQTLSQWLGGYGVVEYMNDEAGCIGRAFYGIFTGTTN